MDRLVNVSRLVKRIYIVLWLILIFFFILKLCFGMWYPIVVENDKLMAISEWIDMTPIARYGIYYLLYQFNFIMVYYIISMRYTNLSKKQFVIISSLATISYILEVLLERGIIGIPIYALIELPLMTIIPIYFSKRRLWSVINLFVIILFQLTIMFVRGIDDINSITMVVYLMLMVDYYIFLFILYFRRRYTMGLGGVFFFGDDLKVCKAKLEELKNADANDEDEIKALENHIHNLEIDVKIKELQNEKINK